MEALLTDLRYGARMLWKSKGLTIIAAVSLAAGIGANAAMFSLVNSILLRPRPVTAPERLVELYVGDRGQPYQTASYPSYLEFRERNAVFSGLAAYGIGHQFTLRGADDVEQVWGEAVSANYFEVLGVQAQRGRTFLPEEDQVTGRNPVVVIGHALWQRRFASDPELIGKAITINNQSLTVVGIAPPQYTGMMRGWASEIWVPTMMMPLMDPSSGERLLTRDSRWLTMIGRLKPGTTIEQARARFDVLTTEMLAAHPDAWRRDNGRDLFVSVLPESATRVHPAMGGAVYGVVALLFAIVDLVLVIACMNLASMLFARAVARRSEIAIRLALGAGRARIVRQLLTESVLLSVMAGAVGVVASLWALDLAMALMPAFPEGIRVAIDLRVDWLVVAYSTAFAIITGVLFGLAPALHGTRAAVSTVLKDDASAFASAYRRSRARATLVIAQVAFSLLLLIGAGLMMRSLDNVRPTRLGFSTENILVAPVTLDETQYDRRMGQQFYQRLSERIAGLPGVEAVSFVDGVPGGFTGRTRRSTEIEGYAPRANESLEIDASIVGPRYFTNMRVPFVQGRDFGDRDREGAPCVAIINEAFAQRYFAGSPAILGKHLAKYEGSRDKKSMCAIVGVVRDTEWQSLQKQARPFYAMPLLQSGEKRMTLMVTTVGDPQNLTSAVRQTIRELDPNIPVTDVQTLNEYFSVAAYPFRMLGMVVGACGILALLLASVGIYGIVSYSVAQRKREVGIRMALGAMHLDILRLVVGQGMVLVGYGLAGGLLLSVALTRVLTSLPLDTDLLFGVSPTDAMTFGGVTMVLALVALAACYIPARRATRVDPMVTLRNA